MNTQVDGSTLTCLDDLVIKLLLHFLHHFLDAGRMDAAVSNELMESEATGLATDRIETADDDSLWGVIDDYLNAAGSLKGTYVAALTSENAALHLVVVDVENGNAFLNGSLSGYTLDGLNDDFLGLSVGIELGLVHDLVDIAGGSSLCLVLEALHEAAAGLIGAES